MPDERTLFVANIPPEDLGLPDDSLITLSISKANEAAQPDPLPDPDPIPEPDVGGFPAQWAKAVLNLPPYPKEEPLDGRDVGVRIRNNVAYRYRFQDAGTPENPGSGPVIAKTLGTRGTVNLYDAGARGTDRNADSAAMAKAVTQVKDGGKVFVPYGSWLVSGVNVPGHKDMIIEGETELGAELVGAPGQDILIWDDDNTQRRLQNRPIIKNMRFYMKGSGQRGNFNRKTHQGWNVGAACLAWVQRSPTSDGNRKQAWGNSYLTVQNCTARGDKSAIGATFLYSDRALYGCRVQNLFIGDHGTDVSGLHGGLIMGRPPFNVAEYAPDEFGVDHFVHWGGLVSIAVSNIANGHVRDHKAYSCRFPLHLTGQVNQGPRDRGRELELSSLYYDNDVIVSNPGDQEMLHLDVDNCVFNTIHFKGSRNGNARPKLMIRGSNVKGGIIALYSSASHRAPEFDIQGSGHEFTVDAGGFSAQEKQALFNDRSAHPGIKVT